MKKGDEGGREWGSKEEEETGTVDGEKGNRELIDTTCSRNGNRPD